MAITDLTGYTWVGNETLVFESNFEYKINIKDKNNIYEYDSISSFFRMIPPPGYYRLTFGQGTMQDTIVYTEENDQKWGNGYYREIEITGGVDATNTELISWLEANGTLTKPAITQLAPFLTNIANAIRKKKGTTAQINAQDFASEIESIESGGAGGE